MTYRPYNKIVPRVLGQPYSNASGVNIPKATPVRSNASGDVDFINVSNEAEVKAIIGVTSEEISDGSKGDVASTGRVENITTSADFGDALYISKTGGLTNVEPDVGVGGFLSGDFVVRIGSVVKNIDNPPLKDLILDIDIVGQL